MEDFLFKNISRTVTWEVEWWQSPLHLIPTLSFLWLGRVSGKTTSPRESQCSHFSTCSKQSWLQNRSMTSAWWWRPEIVFVYSCLQTHSALSQWEFLLGLHRVSCKRGGAVGERQTAASYNPPTQATRVFRREVGGKVHTSPAPLSKRTWAGGRQHKNAALWGRQRYRESLPLLCRCQGRQSRNAALLERPKVFQCFQQGTF